MAKSAGEERIEQFRRDLRLLKRKYSSKEIGRRAKIGSGNLSSYNSNSIRRKKPGEKTLDKFYKEFDNEIKNMDYKHPSEDDAQHPAEEPAPIRYLRAGEVREGYVRDDRDDQIIQLLHKANNSLEKTKDTLLAGITEVIAHNGIAVRSTEKAIQTTADAVKSTKQLVRLVVAEFGGRKTSGRTRSK